MYHLQIHRLRIHLHQIELSSPPRKHPKALTRCDASASFTPYKRCPSPSRATPRASQSTECQYTRLSIFTTPRGRTTSGCDTSGHQHFAPGNGFFNTHPKTHQKSKSNIAIYTSHQNSHLTSRESPKDAQHSRRHLHHTRESHIARESPKDTPHPSRHCTSQQSSSLPELHQNPDVSHPSRHLHQSRGSHLTFEHHQVS